MTFAYFLPIEPYDVTSLLTIARHKLLSLGVQFSSEIQRISGDLVTDREGVPDVGLPDANVWNPP